MPDHLSKTTRSFFQEVRAAALMSPFSDARYELDARLTSLPPDDSEVVPKLIARLQKALGAVPKARALGAEDRELLGYAALFEAFHRFADDFDALIEAQRGKTDPVPFVAHRNIAEYLTPFEVDVERSLELFYQLRRAFVFLTRRLPGDEVPMRALRHRLWQQLFGRDTLHYHRRLEGRMQDFSLLLVGETGTGKTSAAGCLGRAGRIPWKGDRFTTSYERLFIAANLSEVPGELLTSALFGHQKGAFTGAIANRAGIFARSDPHGVVFLDEIGELHEPGQIKLLRVLQERSFSPVGSDRTERFDGRVIAATHRDPDTLVGGRMREDFYYRLCSDVVRVPSLQERIASDEGALRRLVESAVTRVVGTEDRAMAEEIAEVIERTIPADYAWPGNVRELEQTVRAALLTGEVKTRRAPESKATAWRAAEGGDLPLRELVRSYVAHVRAMHPTLEATARHLGVDRRTVQKHLS
ncbi:MAG: sigma 54-interacting transcriptional regulator [Myxococcota bacterium]